MAKAKKKIGVVLRMHTVGVRFINGANIGKVYTYKVPRRAEVFPGAATRRPERVWHVRGRGGADRQGGRRKERGHALENDHAEGRATMTTDFNKLRTAVRFLLENAAKFEWSLQGLGMLRLYLPDDTRLHVWDTRHAYPGASPIHDHQQWSLHSTVISGCIRNIRYIKNSNGEPFHFAKFKAGYGTQRLSQPETIHLLACIPELHHPGDSYAQHPEEIHQTVPNNGTVTIMRKTPTADPESARIFWEEGTEWGSAEPRRATDEEVRQMTEWALERWI